MTKILHTSDWHLGHTLYSYDLLEEQQDMLRQVISIVDREQPDLFLLSGDIYHTAQAPALTQQVFADALVALHRAAPQMDIVCTAGNHDSGSRHDIFHTPWKEFCVNIFGMMDRDHPVDRHVLHFPGKAWVVALPYFYAGEDTFAEVLRQLLDSVTARNTDGEPVIVMAHVAVSGSDFTGHRRMGERTVGGIDAIGADRLGDGFDYLALGHIHRPQWVGGAGSRMRYCGSPLPVSFEETFDHSVSLIDIGQHGDAPVLREVPISNPRPLVTLPATGYAPWEEALEALKSFPDDQEAYIRLNVRIDGSLPPTADALAREAAKDKHCRYCLINVQMPETEAADFRAMDLHQFQQAEPLDIIRHYAQDKKLAFTPEMEQCFNVVMREVEQEQNEDPQ
jgi:exonuclease SbcD